jgi:ubiquinol oxidase
MLKSLVFDNLFIGKERDYARFYALETIARMPYFSYLSVLHFYETIGRWRKANYLKLHFAESWNELHHLLIMEELGGSELWRDRFVAQHIAVAYFWMVFGMYLFNPTLAYNLNQHVEEHAYATYDKYAKDNEEYLKQQPAPQIAIEYYTNPNNVYMFDEFQSHNFGDCHPPRRRPVINNLYDVFMAVRDDELEHVKTMTALQQDVSMSSLNEEDEGCDVPPELLNII